MGKSCGRWDSLDGDGPPYRTDVVHKGKNGRLPFVGTPPGGVRGHRTGSDDEWARDCFYFRNATQARKRKSLCCGSNKTCATLNYSTA